MVWHWGSRQQRAFEASKNLLQSDQVLIHYQSDQDLTVSCDSSGFGLGAVLSHKLADGTERPISFASRSLSAAEKNYSALDHEACAVRKFHRYLIGRKFCILIDHKPLIYLFSETKSTPQMSSSRRLRWSLELGAYDYRIQYQAGSDNQNADSLWGTPDEPGKVMDANVLLLEELDHAPVKAADVQHWTQTDCVLSQVKSCVLRGWPTHVDETLQPFYDRRNELTVEDGCVL